MGNGYCRDCSYTARFEGGKSYDFWTEVKVVVNNEPAVPAIAWKLILLKYVFQYLNKVKAFFPGAFRI